MNAAMTSATSSTVNDAMNCTNTGGPAVRAAAIDQVIQRNDTWMGRCTTTVQRGLATGYRTLDEQLYGNGWPLGNTVELLSDGNGLGAMGLFLPAMEKLSQQGRWQAFIAPPYTPYAPLLEARGIDVQQVLLVHPRSRQDLLWSIEQALRSSTCSAVFAWLGAAEFRYSELRKLQLAAAGSDVFSVLFRARQAAHNHAPAALRLEMKGYRKVHILKQRGGNQLLDVNLGVEDDIPGQPQLWELPAYPSAESRQAPAFSA
jgi:protein ImuA